MPTLFLYCKHCGEPIVQPNDKKPDEWKHFIYGAGVLYYYCDHSEQTHAEPDKK